MRPLQRKIYSFCIETIMLIFKVNEAKYASKYLKMLWDAVSPQSHFSQNEHAITTCLLEILPLRVREASSRLKLIRKLAKNSPVHDMTWLWMCSALNKQLELLVTICHAYNVQIQHSVWSWSLIMAVIIACSCAKTKTKPRTKVLLTHSLTRHSF